MPLLVLVMEEHTLPAVMEEHTLPAVMRLLCVPTESGIWVVALRNQVFMFN